MSTDHGTSSATKTRADGDPAEFNPYSDVFFDDPYETYRWMRDEAPVYYSKRWDFYALTRHEDVVAAHRDWETFSSAYGVTLDGLSMRQRLNANMLIIMDPPEHERLRKLVRQVFTKAAIANLEPLVLQVVTSYVDALKDRQNFDVVADFAALFPVEIISSMLGVPAGEQQQIRLWTDGFLHREENNPYATESGVADSIAMGEYFLELAREKRRNPDDLIISRLVTATFDDEAGVTHRLSDGDIATFAVLIAAAGSETVTKLVGNGVMAFHRNPDQWQLVLADPTLIPGAIEAGHLHFTGRASTLIKTAGSNVSPAEVESVLDSMPEVLHSFVVALPHPVRGQVVGAAVVPSNGARLSVESVVAHARRNLSTFKVPTVIRLIAEDELPMLPTGKVDRQALVRLLTAD